MKINTDLKRYLKQGVFILLTACAGQSAHKKDSTSQSKEGVWSPNVEQHPNIEEQDLGDEKLDEYRARKPVVGVVLEGAAFDSLMMLGFMQEIDRAGLKPEKVVGLGWGCWIALSWAFEGSSNQSEWQAFKWTSWKFLGLDNKGFFSRFTGGRSSYDDYLKEMKVWLTKAEFKDYVLDVDCPLLNTVSSSVADMKTAHTMGVYKALWEQIQIPMLGLKIDATAPMPRLLSGLAAPNMTMDEYDSLSALRKSKSDAKNIDFWIHLKASSPELKGAGDWWLTTSYRRSQSENDDRLQTHQGRWILKMPLYKNQNIDEKKALSLQERRAFLLKGRELARKWLASPWYQDNMAPLLNQ